MKHLISTTAGALLLLILPQSAIASGGHIQARSCPFSCKSEGISKKYCKDWRRGDICYVEDLRNPAHHSPGYHPAKPHHPHYPLNPPHNGYYPTKSCYGPGTRHLPIPQVSIRKVTPSRYHDKFLVSGTVSGSCLTDAGYYERGREKSDLAVSTQHHPVRLPFTVEVRAHKQPEIRVRNSRGGTQRVSLTSYLPSHNYYDDSDHYQYQGEDYGHHHTGSSCSHSSHNHYSHKKEFYRPPYHYTAKPPSSWLRRWKKVNLYSQ